MLDNPVHPILGVLLRYLLITELKPGCLNISTSWISAADFDSNDDRTGSECLVRKSVSVLHTYNKFRSPNQDNVQENSK